MKIIDDARAIINSSGNNFHCKVINYFREKGWYTVVSPYYMDNVSSKPREIDLVAEKPFQYVDYNQVLGSINVKLYIECKFIPQINVFWFAEKDMVKANSMVMETISCFSHYCDRKDHHYINGGQQVAKLFSSENKRDLENEIIYKALNQSLNAMVYLRNTPSIIPEARSGGQNILQTIEYPLIVCNSFEKFVRTDINSNSVPVRMEENFQLEVNYAYMDTENNHRSEYFLIDVLDFNQLDAFLDIIDKDVSAVVSARRD